MQVYKLYFCSRAKSGPGGPHGLITPLDYINQVRPVNCVITCINRSIKLCITPKTFIAWGPFRTRFGQLCHIELADGYVTLGPEVNSLFILAIHFF